MIEFELVQLPPLPNSLLRKHWAKVSQVHKTWRQYVRLATIRHRPKEPLYKAKVTFTRFSSRQPDYDGLVGSFKPVLDGLVEAGILVDDTQRVIGAPIYLWEYAKPKHGKIRVNIQPGGDNEKTE